MAEFRHFRAAWDQPRGARMRFRVISKRDSRRWCGDSAACWAVDDDVHTFRRLSDLIEDLI